MMIKIGILICLIALTSQLVHSKVITINSTSGDTSPECCSKEGCMCASLSTALQYIDSNTIINITSESVTLNNTTSMGSGKLTNITITGSNVTIMCNNSGSVYCESCDDVRIEGITWDRCGDPNGTNNVAITFKTVTNISLVNCTFQHSPVLAVHFVTVSGRIHIDYCKFLSNKGMQLPLRSVTSACGGLSISSAYNFVDLIICDSYFYNNGSYCNGNALNVHEENGMINWNVTIAKTSFFSNEGGVYIHINGDSSIQLEKVTFNDNNKAIKLDLFGNSTVLVSNSLFTNNIYGALDYFTNGGDKTEITISNSNFTNSQCLETDSPTTVEFSARANTSVLITLVDVEISHSCVLEASRYRGSASLLIDFNAPRHSFAVEVHLIRVRLLSNTYLGDRGGAVYIAYNSVHSSNYLDIEECEFFNNTSHRGAALYIDNYAFSPQGSIDILNSTFDHNTAHDSVIYMDIRTPNYIMPMYIISCNFTNNIGSSVHLLQCQVSCENSVFANNTADNGAALYINKGSTIKFFGTIQFINNSATEYGGAIYILLVYGWFGFPFPVFGYGSVSFVNNTAEISGNSLYFSIPTLWKVEKNVSMPSSLLYVPCQFNYTQSINGKMVRIPCDLDYTLLNGTGAPIVISPHELRLYFPFNDGYNISSSSNQNIYFITSNILGQPVKFTGAVFDYFGKPAEPTQFNIKCTDCAPSIVLPKITFFVDNVTSLSITFSGANIQNRLNVTVMLTSALRSISEISATFVVELLPCVDHPGYTYSTASKGCICYHHNVDCHDNYTEIKRGYWFGSVMNTTTTGPCPRYCRFIDRTETRQGYFELPNTINAQCNDHRVGRACGECSSGYTLSYDSTDCISVDQCGSGWTVLVIMLTWLYWIIMIAGVFSLMYFRFQISLGYLYGLIYYYSIVRILLNSNPYLSGGVFQFASVLSSFAQLTPQFLGKLCFVKGLSGIDQLFIHYSHAVAVSLLLLLIVVTARFSTRITLFVSRCIIRVICLLILLSYTSIVSTSLQLLQPLKFTDVKEWYTYSSPHIQYFHGRHAVYGIVAILCELVVGIALPLLLLLEPVLNKKINFIRIKPLLDQFQGCYKDKYRWFAAYYLICRQVIILIVYGIDGEFFDMLFYLQTACLIIALIHVWIQPYQSDLLNALDGVILLLMIQPTAALFNDSALSVTAVILLLLPLIFFSAVVIRKGIDSYNKKKRRNHVNNPDVYDGVAAEDNIVIRNSISLDEIDEPQNRSYNTFQESLLDYTSNNDK